VVQHATVDAALAVEIASLREMAAVLREQLADTRQERDRWRAQAERLALPSQSPPRWSWRWLRSSCLCRRRNACARRSLRAAPRLAPFPGEFHSNQEEVMSEDIAKRLLSAARAIEVASGSLADQ
jgi:hypothetical protein